MTQFKLRSALLFTLWMVNPYSVWAEGGGSDQQSNPIPFQAALGAKKELTEAEEKIDLKTSYQDGRVETFIHVKTLASLIAEYLDHPTRCIAVSHSSMPYDKSFRAELDRQFVKIPEGRIRKNVGKVRSEPDFKNVKSFHAMRYAVTRSLWEEVMGGMPPHVPAEFRPTWKDCPDCPVTYVSWWDCARDEKGGHILSEDGNGIIQRIPAEIQIFLETLNEKTKGSGFYYDIPTRNQLEYMWRADETGKTLINTLKVLLIKMWMSM